MVTAAAATAVRAAAGGEEEEEEEEEEEVEERDLDADVAEKVNPFLPLSLPPSPLPSSLPPSLPPSSVVFIYAWDRFKFHSNPYSFPSLPRSLPP